MNSMDYPTLLLRRRESDSSCLYDDASVASPSHFDRLELFMLNPVGVIGLVSWFSHKDFNKWKEFFSPPFPR